MKKSYLVLQIVFVIVAGVSFSIGITGNPSFNVFDFFMGVSTEIIGWILGVTVFQFFYDAKLSAKRRRSGQDAESAPSVADELIKCKALLDGGVITEEEFAAMKNRLLAK